MIRLPKYPKFGGGDQAARVLGIGARLEIDFEWIAPRSIAMTGSNGKGSTAAMLASIFTASGLRCGLFTSPHLFAINERIAVDGVDIADDALAQIWSHAEAAADGWLADHPGQSLGAFEFLFLLAASYFQALRCQRIVWEAGIGGRHDVTRFARAPHAAIVALDLEHTQLLGATLEEIAYDKADIAPDAGVLHLGEGVAPFAELIRAHVAPRGVRCEIVRERPDLRPSLAGAHQRANAALAAHIAAFSANLGEAQIAEGLARTRWPGRLERLDGALTIVIDVGHTPDAVARALAGFIELAGPEPHALVCGVSTDKDAAGVINALTPHFARIIATRAFHKGRAASEIAALARAANPDAEVSIAEDIGTAHAQAVRLGMPVYVAGGLFVAAEFKAAHLGMDPAALAFF